MRYITGFDMGNIIAVEDKFPNYNQAVYAFDERADSLPKEADSFVLAKIEGNYATIIETA